MVETEADGSGRRLSNQPGRMSLCERSWYPLSVLCSRHVRWLFPPISQTRRDQNRRTGGVYGGWRDDLLSLLAQIVIYGGMFWFGVTYHGRG